MEQGSRILRLSLAETIFLAIRNNRGIKSAYIDRVIQKVDLKVAEDKFMPDVNLDGGIQYFQDDAENEITSGNISVNITETIPTGGKFTFKWAEAIESSGSDSWGISFSQPLLKGAGKNVNNASIDTARIQEQININNLRSKLIDTVTNVIFAYRNYVQTVKRVEIANLSLKRAQELLEVNKLLIQTGQMAAMEIVQTEATLASRHFDHQDALNTKENAMQALIKILDIDKQTEIISTEKVQVDLISVDYQKCIEMAFNNRSDYLNTLLNLETAKINLQLAENNRLWDLSLDGSYSKNDSQDQNNGTNNSENYNIMLSVRIPLYGDLSRNQAFVKAKMDLKKTKLSLEELKDNIEIDLKNSLRDLDSKLKLVRLSQQAHLLTEKKLQIEKEKLSIGRSNNFTILAFQDDLIKAQLNELTAVISYQNALAELDRKLGETLSTWKIEFKDSIKLNGETSSVLKTR